MFLKAGIVTMGAFKDKFGSLKTLPMSGHPANIWVHDYPKLKKSLRE